METKTVMYLTVNIFIPAENLDVLVCVSLVLTQFSKQPEVVALHADLFQLHKKSFVGSCCLGLDQVWAGESGKARHLLHFLYVNV